jgi:DNA processing protein
LAQAERLGARVVIPEDDEWPPQLDHLREICADRKDPVDRDAAPPLCLWVRGQPRLDEALDRSVAVVGARAATGYGTHAARQIGYGLAAEGWTVVSGGAFGIDAAAHRGALAAGGLTVVVFATGIDRAYPASHANLFDRIAEDGLLVSEWPPGTDPFRHRFLIRNRLIAAMTQGTVLVEAGARSGSRQTFHRAGQLKRCRMVVPGPVTSALSVGCHHELREDPAARLVTGAPHVLEEVGRLGTDLAPVPRGPEQPRDRLEPVERRLIEALLKRKPLSSQALATRARVPFVDASRILPSLVVRGLVQRREHGFVLAPQPSKPQQPPKTTPAPASRLDSGDGVAGPSSGERADSVEVRGAAGADAPGGG